MGGWAIAVHGGAGVDPNLPLERQEEAKRIITRCLNLGISALRSNLSAIDVVELVVRELETDPFFNSGRGSALTEKGTVEMEASIMDGNGRRCGAVSGVTNVKNPVSLARLVMEKSPHSYLAFSGAEDFARQQGVEMVDNDYFITDDNVGMLKLAKEAKTILYDYRIPITGLDSCGALTESPIVMNGLPIHLYAPETVGCAVVDSQGRCAAATSTGGLMNKKTGRIGDSPLIGAGTYAGELCGVSCTGEGEAIIRGTLARDVAALMEYKGLSLQGAVDYVVNKRLDQGKAGLIAVSKDGEVAYGFNTMGIRQKHSPEGRKIKEMGRVKLEIKKIENTTNRQVTYSKRRNGLMKKAYELSVLCDVDVALIMFSPSGRLTFFSGTKSIEEIIARYLNLPEHERGTRVHNQEILQKALGKLKYEADTLRYTTPPSRCLVGADDSHNAKMQTSGIQQELFKCKSQLEEMEKRLRSYEGDPWEIQTLCEAEYREQILQDTLKKVQANKHILEDRYNSHIPQDQSQQVDLAQNNGFTTRNANDYMFDWIPERDSCSLHSPSRLVLPTRGEENEGIGNIMQQSMNSPEMHLLNLNGGNSSHTDDTACKITEGLHEFSQVVDINLAPWSQFYTDIHM